MVSYFYFFKAQNLNQLLPPVIIIAVSVITAFMIYALKKNREDRNDMIIKKSKANSDDETYTLLAGVIAEFKKTNTKWNRHRLRKLLKMKKITVNSKDDLTGTTLLHGAVVHGNLAVARLLIDEGAHVNATDNSNRVVLLEALMMDDTPMVELLITAGADVNARGYVGRNALHVAAMKGNAELASLVLTKEADLNAKTKTGETALHIAASRGSSAVVELLLKRGADINVLAENSMTVFHSTARKNRTIVKMLLDHGFKANATFQNGITPLHVATYKGDNDVAELLISRGAEVNRKDVNGRTPIFLAIRNPRMIQLLVDSGADVNVKSNDEYASPLMQAIYSRCHDSVVTLLENGADVRARNKKGLCALELSEEHNDQEIIETLRKAMET